MTLMKAWLGFDAKQNLEAAANTLRIQRTTHDELIRLRAEVQALRAENDDLRSKVEKVDPVMAKLRIQAERVRLYKQLRYEDRKLDEKRQAEVLKRHYRL